jgi:hypothetical protein
MDDISNHQTMITMMMVTMKTWTTYKEEALDSRRC